MLRRLLISVGLTVSIVIPLLSPCAQGRSWVLENFSVVLDVREDGSLLIEETFQPRFDGSFNGIYRTIPVDYRTPEGFNYKLFVSFESATDEKGNSLRCEASREGHYVKYKIWIPGARDATKTVVLHYRVENAIRYFPDHDELYWNATGTEWPVPIEQASALVRLPAAAAGAGLRTAAYTGPFGATASDADIETRGSEVSLRSRRGLGYREGLTVVIGWNKGVVAEPGTLALAWQFLRANWMFGLPIITFVVMFGLWYKRGKDPRIHESVMVLYEPPDKLTPGELGTLVDHKPDLRDITATLVDLAVRGYLRIEELPEEGLIWKRRDYLFRLTKPHKEWSTLEHHERRVLEGVFGISPRPDRVTTLSSLENEFYKRLPEIREALFDTLIAGRYYTRSPENVKGYYIRLGFVIGVVGSFALGFCANWTGTSLLTAIAAGVISGLIILLFGLVMPARTVHGTRIRNQILGFQEFLNRAEKDYLARIVDRPEMFDKFLPYAMALGVERKWALAFKDIYRESPDWYSGHYPDGFRSTSLADNLGAMSSRAGSTFVSTPRSEGSGFGSSGISGFSGGGFSGGGFGGGGGGAF